MISARVSGWTSLTGRLWNEAKDKLLKTPYGNIIG